nr:hypothetical protein [uncultured Chryseobacterium sp.]
MNNKDLLTLCHSIIGKNKKDILTQLGDGFNFYPDSIWTYEIKKTWWGKKTILAIEFENNKVIAAKIKNSLQ